MDNLRDFATACALSAKDDQIEAWDCLQCLDTNQDASSALLKEVDSVSRVYWQEWTVSLIWLALVHLLAVFAFHPTGRLSEM